MIGKYHKFGKMTFAQQKNKHLFYFLDWCIFVQFQISDCVHQFVNLSDNYFHIDYTARKWMLYIVRKVLREFQTTLSASFHNDNIIFARHAYFYKCSQSPMEAQLRILLFRHFFLYYLQYMCNTYLYLCMLHRFTTYLRFN